MAEENKSGVYSLAQVHLTKSFKIDQTSSNLLSGKYTIFKFDDPITVSKKPDFVSRVVISENSNSRSKEVEASFGIAGSYYAFSAAAEASLSSFNASTMTTIRADHDLYALKYEACSEVLDFADCLLPKVVKFVKNNSPEKIVQMLGEFFATNLKLGGHFQLTQIIKSQSSDTASSMRASVEASYGVAMVGSVQAKATAGKVAKSHVEGRESSNTMTVRGGDMDCWLGFTGAADGEGSQADCQRKWAESITDEELYPLQMTLLPIWEAFEGGDDELQAKAADIKAHLKDKWDAMRETIAKLQKTTADAVDAVGDSKQPEQAKHLLAFDGSSGIFKINYGGGYSKLAGGNWGKTTCAAHVGNDEVVIMDGSSGIYKVNASTGKYDKIGGGNWGSATAACHVGNGKVMVLDGGNGIYEVNVGGGYKKLAGGNWAKSGGCCYVGNGKVVVLDGTSGIYEIKTDGNYKKIGGGNWSKTKCCCYVGNGNIIVFDGTSGIYQVKTDGNYSKLCGGNWSKSGGCAYVGNNKVVVMDGSSGIYEVDIGKKNYKKIGGGNWSKTRCIGHPTKV